MAEAAPPCGSYRTTHYELHWKDAGGTWRERSRHIELEGARAAKAGVADDVGGTNLLRIVAVVTVTTREVTW